MTVSTSEILDILRAYGIEPEERIEGADLPSALDHEFPEIGEIVEGETIYSTSIAEVLREPDVPEFQISVPEDPRILEWQAEIRAIAAAQRPENARRILERLREKEWDPPEPQCAWYCPIHFFGNGWGIYIRERCILSLATNIASFVDWSAVRSPITLVFRQLLRSAFYAFFLHEQFHHKVESLGFRLLIASKSDRFRPYKRKVYRRSFLTVDCLEESLANAESYRRLSEPRYTGRVERAIRGGLRDFLSATIPFQPPGYAQGLDYVSEDAYRDGLYKLQSQILDGALVPATLASHWSVAPNMIKALMDITDDIYVVLPKGARPIFRATSVDPGYTVSTGALVGALTKHYGYQRVAGGKGSHVKLKKPGSQTIIVPGDGAVLSPGIVKHALGALGGYPISRLPDLLDGRLRATA